jgi:hypothetical protein
MDPELMKQNKWNKIKKPDKKTSKSFHWTLYTEEKFIEQYQWKKIGKLKALCTKGNSWSKINARKLESLRGRE